MGALILARIKRLVFAAEDPKAGACGSVLDLSNKKELNHKIEVKKHILEEESKKLIQEFFRNKRDKRSFNFFETSRPNSDG
jgi:tRNA(adenine34) deaminase